MSFIHHPLIHEPNLKYIMMKIKRIKLLVYIVLASISSITVFAQAPQALTYQGEARDDNGRIIRNQTLELFFSIYCDDPDHFYTWENAIEITTDEFGMFTAILGDPGGTDELFNEIPWEYPPIYLTVNMEYKGNWSGDTIQFLSVPYALSAGSVDYNDILNKPDHFEGNISFENDITVNDLTVGRGNNSVERNSAFGMNALSSNSTGRENTAIGYRALNMNETGNQNTAVGSWTLYENTTGKDNTAIGNGALHYNSEGRSNTAVGNWALSSNTTGTSNTGIGAYALSANKTGKDNIAMGYSALGSNSLGNYNVATGVYALQSNTEGSFNSAYGYSALKANETGTNNVALGVYAMEKNTSGNSKKQKGYHGYFSQLPSSRKPGYAGW